MKTSKPDPPGIVRTGRGLTIAGTRLTLYSVMDYLKADWPPALIRDWLDLSDQQLATAMAYIEAHREEVEKEYGIVLQQAAEIRRYWEERQPPRLASSIAEPLPRHEAIRAKLRRWKDKLEIA